MGDRANVLMKSDKDGVYLYTHWQGYELPQAVQNALKRKERWDDEPYLTRIVFCEMIKGQESEETGYGISSYLGDGDDRIIYINTKKQTVKLLGIVYSFKEYIKLNLDNVEF